MAGKRNHYRDRGFTRGTMTHQAINQVVAALRQAGDHVEAAAKAALKEGVDVVVAEAKSRCPVYEGTKVKKKLKSGTLEEYLVRDKRATPGQLRDSIHAVDRYGDGSWYNISADAVVETSKGPLYYGAIVEFSPKINKPFLYPALDEHKERVQRKIVLAVQQAVERGK